MPSKPLATGILPAQRIEKLVQDGFVTSSVPIDKVQIQPASLDLRLGRVAYRLQASFLPGMQDVTEKLKTFCLHTIPLENGAILETRCVYLIPLLEQLALPEELSAFANPKSSTGRLDVFARLLTHQSTCFDKIDKGYHGPLYVEVCPQTFPILVRTGSKLNQLRFCQGYAHHNDEVLTAYLGEKEDDLIGFRAKAYTGLIDIDAIAAYASQAFWDPLYVRHNQPFILQPNAFYILRSEQTVCIPKHLAAEMVPYDPLIGEFRAHYAGFFDPGFGLNQKTYAVLEVRNHEMPFILDKGQTVARLVYAPLVEETYHAYGQADSHYTDQHLRLSKHFV